MTSIGDTLYIVWQIVYPICLGVINFCVVIGLWMWLSHPRYLCLIFRRYLIWKAGLKLRNVTVDKTKYRIAVKGIPDQFRPSLLFIHGFSTDLSGWCSVVESFAADAEHVIVMDLPGHGSSWISADEDFDVEPLAKKLKKILDHAGFSKQPIHVVGASLGGALAGVMAAVFPDQVELVTIICPLTNGGVMSEFRRRLLAGDLSWMLPTTKDQLRIMFRHVCYKPLSIPGPIVDGILEDRLQRYNFHEALFQHLMDEKNSCALLRKAKEIKQPTQIIWGNQDEIIPIEELDGLRAVLPNLERCDIIDECGHSIYLEQPEMLLKYLNLFRKNYELKKYK